MDIVSLDYIYESKLPGSKLPPRLAQLDKRQSAEREVVGSNPARKNTQGLKITEQNVLPLLRHLHMVRHSSLLGKGRKTVGPVSQLFHCSE